jgi:hypothetical protein
MKERGVVVGRRIRCECAVVERNQNPAKPCGLL